MGYWFKLFKKRVEESREVGEYEHNLGETGLFLYKKRCFRIFADNIMEMKLKRDMLSNRFNPSTKKRSNTI